MKLGIGSYTYAWAVGVPGSPPPCPLDARALCQRALDLGVRVVQLCDNLPLPDSELDGLLDFARRHGLTIEWGTRGLDDATLNGIAPRLAMFGCPFVRLVVDRGPSQPSPAEVVDRLRHWLATLPDSVSIALENHDRFSAAQLAAIIEATGRARVGITLDTVNSFGALEGPRVVVETLAPYVINLHVKDFVVQRVPSQMGFIIEGRPAGQGQLDIPWLLDALRAAGRHPNAILELWTPPADTLDDTLRRESQWAESSVAFLRRFLSD